MTKKKHYEKTHGEDPKASFILDGKKECYLYLNNDLFSTM